ncbi:hypothetical protein WJX72_008132 [[Myrmecia] bisecta]|uniref:Uncharacterized protein n=1 Tax=[Myrmecia] bisecta TaxID=41462 RepID=A0AAW1P9V4_9CHLO
MLRCLFRPAATSFEGPWEAKGPSRPDPTAGLAEEFGWSSSLAATVRDTVEQAEEDDPTLVIEEWNEDRLVECAQDWGLIAEDAWLTHAQREIAAEAAKKCIVLFLLTKGAEGTAHPNVFRFTWQTYERCRLAIVNARPNIFAATEITPAIAANLNVPARTAVASTVTIFRQGCAKVVLSPTPFFCLIS